MPAGLVGWIIKAALDWLYTKLREYIASRKKQEQNHNENDARSDDDFSKTDELKKNPEATEQDRDAATDDRLSRF